MDGSVVAVAVATLASGAEAVVAAMEAVVAAMEAAVETTSAGAGAAREGPVRRAAAVQVVCLEAQRGWKVLIMWPRAQFGGCGGALTEGLTILV